jgi:hypothetical protein
MSEININFDEKYSRIIGVEPLFFLMEEGLDLLKAFLVFGNIEIFLNDSNKHVQDNDWTHQFLIRYQIRVGLTVGKNEPKDTERSADPCCAIFLLVVGDSVQDAGPILTGENLIHPEERVVDVEEGYAYNFTVIFLWYLATEELRREDGCKKCE